MISEQPSSTGSSSRRLRVLVAAPSPHQVGGQAHAARDIERGFAGHSEVIVRVQAIDPRLSGGLQFLTEWKILRSVVRPLLYLRALIRAAPVTDLFHVFCAAHFAFLFGAVPAFLVARLFRLPVVLNYHDGRAEAHFKLWGPFLRWVLNQAEIVVFPSSYLREIFERHGVCGRVVPNVVDIATFSRETQPCRPHRLISARSLEPLYGVDNTIRAFAQIRNIFPDAVLEVYGDGRSAGALHRLAEEVGSDGIRFCGFVPHSQMPKVFAGGGVLVNSSRVDNMPHLLIEALAAGLPIVTTRSGGIPYLVEHERNALMVPVDDPEALANAVVRVLQDSDLADRLIEQGRVDCEKFTWHAAERGWLQVYRYAVNSSLLEETSHEDALSAEQEVHREPPSAPVAERQHTME